MTSSETVDRDRGSTSSEPEVHDALLDAEESALLAAGGGVVDSTDDGEHVLIEGPNSA